MSHLARGWRPQLGKNKFALGFIFTSILTTSGAAWAQMSDRGTQPPQPNARFEMTGKEAHFIFFDGREASLFAKFGQKKVIPVQLSQIENTCRPREVAPRCRLEIEVIPAEISLRWTKNSDSKKVGNIVSVASRKVENKNAATLRHMAPESLSRQFTGERLICDNLSWLKDAQELKDRVYLIQSWSGEIMLDNQETSLSENQSLAAQYNVELKMLNSNEAKLVSYGFQGGLKTSSLFILAPITTLRFFNTSGSVCQVAFQVDLSGLRKVIEGDANLDFDKLEKVPLIEGLNSIGNLDLGFMFANQSSNSQIE